MKLMAMLCGLALLVGCKSGNNNKKDTAADLAPVTATDTTTATATATATAPKPDAAPDAAPDATPDARPDDAGVDADEEPGALGRAKAMKKKRIGASSGRARNEKKVVRR